MPNNPQEVALSFLWNYVCQMTREHEMEKTVFGEQAAFQGLVSAYWFLKDEKRPTVLQAHSLAQEIEEMMATIPSYLPGSTCQVILRDFLVHGNTEKETRPVFLCKVKYLPQ